MNKKALSIVLVILFSVLCFPFIATAADGTIDIDGTYDISAYGNDSVLTIDSAGSAAGLTVTLTNTSGATYTNLQINCVDAGTKLTINNVRINNSAAANAYALAFNGTGNTLTLVGSSTLAGGANEPGVRVETTAALTIGGSGSLSVTGGQYGAGIGAGEQSDGGSITIESGSVTATGGYGGAGIGGGYGVIVDQGSDYVITDAGNGGAVTIQGGTVNATGGLHGAGIGAGRFGSGGQITIEGGSVTAVGYSGGAGIGGGNCELMSSGIINLILAGTGDGGTIRISGGVVNASGQYNGDAHADRVAGAGIGGGFGGTGGTIEISGGEITAVSCPNDTTIYTSAGIGGGGWNDGGTTTISGGTVTAIGGDGGAGIGGGCVYNFDFAPLIGGGDGAGGVINIQGGTVTATSRRYGAGIGGGGSTEAPIIGASGGTISISGGVVYADGSTEYNAYDVGSGANASAGTLTISGTSSVFLRSNSSLTPTLPVPHLHKTTTDAVEPMEVVNGTVYGIAGTGVSPWADALGGYFLLNRIVYSANGGEGAVSNSAQVPDSTALVKASEGMSLSGYVFSSWNTTEDGTGITYMPNDPLTLSASSITLYAQWEVAPVQVPQTGDTTAPYLPLYAALALLSAAGIIALVCVKTKPKAR